MTRKLLILCTFILAASILAGCGTLSNERTLNQIKSKGELTNALPNPYQQFNYICVSGKLAGLNIDIANALADKIGVNAKQITTQLSGTISGFRSKRFNTILRCLAITDKRSN